MSAPYHVRLAVSQAGDQFRAELFTEDLGDTDGDTLRELPPSLGEWVPFLAQGADLPPDAARQLGKELFAALLGQVENAKKWTEVLDRAAKAGQPVRLLIDATTDAVRDLPYGLLCEPHDDWFLFRASQRRSVRFVRILRRCSPRVLRLGKRPTVLIVAAEPVSADVPAYDAPARLMALCAALKDVADVNLCGPDGVKPLADLGADAAAFAPFTKATRDTCKAAVAGPFEIIHLLAHGHGAGVLLCTPDGAPAETTAGELAEWCGAGAASLAFLQVCKAGQTGGRGGFGGVAQQLLSPHGGNLAAVVASAFPLDAEHSTAAAAAFYRQLAAGKSPEEALTADRPETDWCWAFLELWARPGALGGTKQRAAFQFVSPYRGLSSFTERDADLFFGRRSETTELLNILRTEACVGVVGDSGSGKTSLLQAGLVYAVRQGGLGGAWRIASLRPGYRPAQSLLTALGAADGTTLAAALRADPRPLLVIFDQFEEVFTLARDPAEARELTQALADIAADRPERFRLVVGLRSEFLGQAAGLPGLSKLLRRPWVLRPPGGDNLREIVAGPAAHCGYAFEGPLADGTPAHATGLLDRILADPLLATRDGAVPSLPLLQFALERLWLTAVEHGRTTFTHADYDALGGLGTAIAQHAEAVYQASTATLGVGGRAEAEHVFTGLVSDRGTRQPRPRAGLEAESANPDLARAVIDYLVGERLLTVRTDPTNPAVPLVDLAHEAVIRHWDRLRGWLAEDPQGRAMREAFRQSAERWEAGYAGVPPKSTRGLPGADVGRNYLAWIDASRPNMSPMATEFAAAVRRYLARQKTTRALVMATFAWLAVTACVLAGFAVVQTGKATDSARAATKSAADAKASAEEAKGQEREATAAARKARVEATKLALDRGVQMSELGRPRLGLLSMAYSLGICPPAAAGEDAAALRKVILTNLAGWSAHMLRLQHVTAAPYYAIATDPAGRVVLCRTPDGGARLYGLDGPADAPPAAGAPLPRLSNCQREHILSAVVHADCETVLLADEFGYLRLWNGRDGTPLGAEFQTFSAGQPALAPDGRTVAVADAEGTVSLWDGVTGREVERAVPEAGPGGRRVAQLPHPGKVYGLDFSPDGRRLVTACGRRPGAAPGPPGLVQLWDAEAGTLLRRNPTDAPATCAAFSPDGRWYAGGAFDLFIWDNQRDIPPFRLGKEQEPVGRRVSPESTFRVLFDPRVPEHLVALNPSGGLAFTHPREQYFGSGERLSPQGWVVGAGFRADGRLFTANVDGTVRVWAEAGGTGALQEFRPADKPAAPGGPAGPPPAVLCVDYSPDGRLVASGTRDGSVYLFAAAGGPPRAEFVCAYRPDLSDRRPVAGVRFTPAGDRLVAQDLSFRQFVFAAPAPGGPAGPAGPLAVRGKEPGHGLEAVCPGGRYGLVRTSPRGFKVLDLDGEKAPVEFALPAGGYGIPVEASEDGYLLRVTQAAFSPDGGRVAVCVRSGDAYVVDLAATPAAFKHLAHDAAAVYDTIREVAFSPDGATVLTRSQRASAVWDAATGELVGRRTNRIGIQLTRFSPSGRLVLGAANFNSGEVWAPARPDAPPLLLVHGGEVWGIAADRAEGRVVTASFDRTARVWDLATGKPVSRPLRHDQGVSDADFSPDGTLVLTGSWDGTMRLWQLPAPFPDDEPRVRAWIEVVTGMAVTPDGIGTLMSAAEWQARRQDLTRLGGPLVPPARP